MPPPRRGPGVQGTSHLSLVSVVPPVQWEVRTRLDSSPKPPIWSTHRKAGLDERCPAPSSGSAWDLSFSIPRAYSLTHASLDQMRQWTTEACYKL